MKIKPQAWVVCICRRSEYGVTTDKFIIEETKEAALRTYNKVLEDDDLYTACVAPIYESTEPHLTRITK